MPGQEEHVHEHIDTNPLGSDSLIEGAGSDDVLLGGDTHDTVVGNDGDDTLIGDGVDVLLGHGDFDDYPHTDGRYGYTNTAASEFDGWIAPDGYSILTEEGYSFPDTGRGQILELASDRNVSYFREIGGLKDGDVLRLSLDIALPDASRVGGSDGIRIIWNGEVVAEHRPEEKLTWETVSTEFVAGSGDGTNTLELQGIGRSDYWGAVIDNVQLFTVDDEVGGRDYLRGGAGEDTLLGGADNDFLEGGLGADIMDGGSGIDSVTYLNSTRGVTVNLATGRGSRGEARGDRYDNIENVHGSNHDDTLKGDNGDNRLVGRDGDDNLQGGDGNDTLVGGRGADKLDGGKGDGDVAEYDWSTSGVIVNLTTGTGEGGFAEGDTLKKIEFVYGSHFDDVITGDENVNRLVGDFGDDVLNGMSGNDILVGGHGADTLIGGEGERDAADYQTAEEAVVVDLVAGGSAGDAWGDTYDGVEFVYGSDFDDTILGDDAINRLVGNAGNDTLSGRAGNDYLLGGEGDDILTGGEGDDVFLYQAIFGNDTITDFEAGAGRTDRIWLDSLGVAAFDTLVLNQTGEGVEIDLAAYGTLLLVGLQTSDLVADDFIF